MDISKRGVRAGRIVSRGILAWSEMFWILVKGGYGRDG